MADDPRPSWERATQAQEAEANRALAQAVVDEEWRQLDDRYLLREHGVTYQDVQNPRRFLRNELRWFVISSVAAFVIMLLWRIFTLH
jgi:hypothetical protein